MNWDIPRISSSSGHAIGELWRWMAMATRTDMKKWVVAALKFLGGTAWPKDVAKYIWDNYEVEIRRSGSLLYTWQYDARWAATTLRKAGILKAVHGRTDLPWELA